MDEVVAGNWTSWLDCVYHVLTFTSLRGPIACDVLLLALVDSSITLAWQFSSILSSSVIVAALWELMAFGILLSIDLQRLAAVDNCMRRIWLALWPTLLRILLPTKLPPVVDDIVLAWGWAFLLLALSVKFLAFGMEWLGECELITWEFPFTPYSHGQMDESKTSIEFFIAWSYRQQSRNSSIVTTPSWLRSIFCMHVNEPKAFTNWFFFIVVVVEHRKWRTIKYNKLLYFQPSWVVLVVSVQKK